MEATQLLQDGKEEVVQAWYTNSNESEEEQRISACHCEPKEFVSLEKLAAELGILSWRLNTEDYEGDADLTRIREARGYSHTYTFDLHPERMADFEAKVKSFFEEHVHPNEETTFCLQGSGYYDVRDKTERWIRIALKKGGMLLLPAGIYHRFTLDAHNYIKAVLFFVGKPVDSSYKRPNDDLPARKQYIDNFLNKEIASRGGVELISPVN